MSVFIQEIIKTRAQYNRAGGTGSPYGVVDVSGSPYRKKGGRGM